MVRTDPTASAAKADASASRSCAVRDRRRTARPDRTRGRTITGIAMSTRADSFGLVTIISTMAPRKRNALRRAIEAVAPNADFT